jgi:LuxR family maltose regulon positive regulatory protein
MPKATPYILLWSGEDNVYRLFSGLQRETPLLRADERAWFAWLAAHTSFSFRGRHGTLSLHKEGRPRGTDDDREHRDIRLIPACIA